MSHVPCDIQGRLWGGREDKLDADIHQEGSDLKKKKKKRGRHSRNGQCKGMGTRELNGTASGHGRSGKLGHTSSKEPVTGHT